MKKKLSKRERKKLKQQLKVHGRDIETVPQTSFDQEDDEENKKETISVPYTNENVFLTGLLPFVTLSDSEKEESEDDGMNSEEREKKN